jgi:hypothetical protein
MVVESIEQEMRKTRAGSMGGGNMVDAIGVRCQRLHYGVKCFNMNLRGVKK